MRNALLLTKALLLVALASALVAGRAAGKEQDSAEADEAIARIEALGGTITRDSSQPGNPVTSVDLSGKNVKDDDLRLLSKLSSLRELYLIGTDITDAGLKSLVGLQKLEELRVGRTKISDAGLKDLAKLKNLKMVGLVGTQVTEAGVKQFSEAIPNMRHNFGVGEDAADSAPISISSSNSTQLVTKTAVPVWALAFSADGKFLAAGGGGDRDSTAPGLVRVWDFGNRKEVAAYPTATRQSECDALPRWAARGLDQLVGRSLDVRSRGCGIVARYVWVTGADCLLARRTAVGRGAEGTALQLWDGMSGQNVDGFRGETIPFFWLGFSPDGNYMVGAGGSPSEGDNAQAVVWDVASRQQLYTLSDNPQKILFAAISPDSKTLATSGGSSILLRNLATGTVRSRTEESTRPVERIAFSPTGSLLASVGGDSNDGVVTLWDPWTGKVIGTLTGHNRDVHALAFTPDGKTLATGGGDQTIRLWDVATRRQAGVLQEPTGLVDPKRETSTILAAAYSPDGNSVAVANEDGQVSVYGLAPAGLFRSWMAHTDAAAALAYSPDGQLLVSGGYDKVIKFWNPASGELIRSLDGHQGWVTSLAFSHDGRTLASGSYDRSIRLWNVADGIERIELTGHMATVRAVGLFAGRQAVGQRQRRPHRAAVGPGERPGTSHADRPRRGCAGRGVSPDDRLLASGGEDKVIKLWSVDSRQLAGTLTGHTDTVSAVAFAHEKLISTSWDQTIRNWDVANLRMRGSVDTGSSVGALAVAPDGNRLSTAGSQSLALWNARVSLSQPAKAAEEAK